jgi:hypothetical protein
MPQPFLPKNLHGSTGRPITIPTFKVCIAFTPKGEDQASGRPFQARRAGQCRRLKQGMPMADKAEEKRWGWPLPE